LATLCRILEARRPESRWSYYRDVRLVPEGMTFFYAHEALRRMWGTTPADADPPEPKAHRRLPAAERAAPANEHAAPARRGVGMPAPAAPAAFSPA